MGRVLTKADILNANDLQKNRVFCPDWGGDVIIQTMTGLQRDAFEVERMQKRGQDREVNMRNFRAALVAQCAVDESGNKLFTQDEVDVLGQKSALMLEICYDAAARLNGLRSSDVEKLVKNSESVPSAASGSASPSPSDAPSTSSSQPVAPKS